MSVTNPSDTKGSLIAATKVNGKAVYSRARESLGSIYDVMLEKISGKASCAIMSFGGFSASATNTTHFPGQLTYDPERRGYVVDIDRARLEGAPA